MKGQSLIELALCLPVVMILALGSVALVQIEDAQAVLMQRRRRPRRPPRALPTKRQR